MKLSDADFQLAQRLATKRTARNKAYGGAISLSSRADFDLIGLCGEIAFARLFNLPVDSSEKADGGKDFTCPLTLLDIKTNRNAFNLLVEQDKLPTASAQTFALAEYLDTGIVNFLGWATRQEVEAAPCRAFVVNGPINHYIHAAKLRPFSTLPDRIGLKVALETHRIAPGTRKLGSSTPRLLDSGNLAWD